MITAGHAQITEDKLREERQVKAEENDQRRRPPPTLGIHTPRNLWPPKMHASQISHDCAADHHVVEVGDHEVGVVNMWVNPQGGQEESGEPTDGEQSNKSERIEHRRGE